MDKQKRINELLTKLTGRLNELQGKPGACVPLAFLPITDECLDIVDDIAEANND